MSALFRSQMDHLSLLGFISIIYGKQKPCLLFGKQGFEKLFWFFYYLLTSGLSKFVSGAGP